jgi:hypothetical protein
MRYVFADQEPNANHSTGVAVAAVENNLVTPPQAILPSTR